MQVGVQRLDVDVVFGWTVAVERSTLLCLQVVGALLILRMFLMGYGSSITTFSVANPHLSGSCCRWI